MKKSEGKTDNKSGVCACKDYDLIWGNKVSCDFRKKVVEICQSLWPNNYKKMANGLMAVMKVETGGSFKAHQIMGKELKSVDKLVKEDFENDVYVKEDGKLIKKKSSRAVGLIQFTQDALVEVDEFKNGSGFDKLHEVKLRFAKMGEIEQLNFVKKYFEKAKNKIISPEDIYLHVFAPVGVNQKENYPLYERGTEKYTQNKSVDVENNNDGIIQRSEILGRYRISFAEGLGKKEKKYDCSDSMKELYNEVGWHDPIDNPKLCLYTQNGNYRPRYNVFGKVRKERAKINHQGIDLLALPGDSVYACVDSYIEFIETQGGYGKVICLRVKDKEAFLKRKKDYKLVYEDEGEILQGEGFNLDGNIYLFYAHLQSISLNMSDKEVVCGKEIGLAGTTGYGTTKDPHLHFEIRNARSASGLNNRCHPGIFISYKDEANMTKQEKDEQKKIAEKYWD